MALPSQSPLSCVSLSQIPSAFLSKGHLAVEFRAHGKSRAISFEVLHLVTPSETFVPNKVRFTGSRKDVSFGKGLPFNPSQKVFPKFGKYAIHGNLCSHLDDFLLCQGTTFHLTSVLTGFNDLDCSCRFVKKILEDVLGFNKYFKCRWNLKVALSGHFFEVFFCDVNYGS